MSGSIPAIKAAYSDVSPEARNLYEARLREFLNSSSVAERIAATTALFAIHDKEAFVYLVQMASDPSASVRRFAIYYLGELRSRKALAILSERMSDPSSNVRTAARDAFKKIPGARE
jgi:HEAT repeat protein